jgi:hypothetical protein
MFDDIGSVAGDQAPHPRPEATIIQEQPARAASILGAALAYRARGFAVVPQDPGEKKPCVRWKEFQVEPPTVDDLAYWFGRRFPDAGIALVLGPVSGLLVIDVDGAGAHRALVARLGAVPEAPTVLSGSPEPHRYHLFFSHPDILTQASFAPWHKQLEFRGHRGIIVAPPSLHKSGHRYRWAEGWSLDDLPLPAVPGPIHEALRAGARSRARSGPGQPAPTPSEPQTTEQRQARTLAIDLLDGISDRTRFFLLGLEAEGPRWNGKLFDAACDMKGCGIPEEEALPLLLTGARPRTDRDREAAERTIRSAYAHDRRPARALAADRRRANPGGSFIIPVRHRVPGKEAIDEP